MQQTKPAAHAANVALFHRLQNARTCAARSVPSSTVPRLWRASRRISPILAVAMREVPTADTRIVWILPGLSSLLCERPSPGRRMKV